MTPDDLAWLRRLMLDLDRVVRKWDATEVGLDSIRWYIEAFIQEYNQAAPGDRRPGGQDILAASRKRELLEEARARYAAIGATDLKLVPLPGGAYSVLIDGQHRLKLPPQLAALLRVLARPDGTSPDALVAWKSRAQVRDALRAASGRIVSDHALTELVWRLRKELWLQANLHRDFVMVHPALGLRFALQQKHSATTASVSP